MGRHDRHRNIQSVHEAVERGSEEYLLHQVNNGSRALVCANMDVEGQQMSLEVDTIAALSVISEATWKRYWHNKRLLPSTVSLRTYPGAPLLVRGKMLAWVRHGK